MTIITTTDLLKTSQDNHPMCATGIPYWPIQFMSWLFNFQSAFCLCPRKAAEEGPSPWDPALTSQQHREAPGSELQIN